MMHYYDILQHIHFKWLTDYKGLVHLLKQRNLLGRQVWWVEKISKFDFEVVYFAGVDNILANALSWIYSNDSSSIKRAVSEYTYYDVVK
ncbi:hypothetical protein J132_04197 [Termitomyces sp. J132]|nr:hypothetical protein J132_04197 [Termitomyces sp. J132]